MAAQQQSLESLLGISGQRKSLKQQLDAASIKTEAGRTTLADLPTVQIGCKKYIPEEYIANKNRKGRRSWIQAHGFFLTEVSPDLRTLQTYWVCSKCDERGKSSLFVATDTTSPIEHLRRSHMITEADDNADEDSYSSRADIHPPSKRRCLESPTARSNVNKAKELTVGWIVTANLPFTAPSNPYLRRMLDLHDALLAKEVPWSRQSVRDTMRKLFEVKKGVISSQLQKAVTRISFSFDLWTSPNRCFGHILNLAARAFLWGKDPDSFEREAFTEAAFQVEESELRLWRKRGAVGKLHNIIRFVRASPQRRELIKYLACDQNDEDGYQLFEEERAAIDLELMQNNETIWNSTFLMIQRAIRKREHIDHFIAYLETKTSEPRQRVPVQDQLSPQDWLLLAEIQSLLKPLHEITMRCQGWAKEGRHGALWEVMIAMEYLLNFFEEQNLIFSSPDSCISELRNFRVSATKMSGNSLNSTIHGEEQPETSRTVTGKAVRQDEPSQFDHWMQSCDRCMMEEEDELGVYMRQGPVRRENLNPVLWWKDHQEEYRRLSKFALDILAIPAMSVDPERTFSVTKLTSALVDGSPRRTDRDSYKRPAESDSDARPVLSSTSSLQAAPLDIRLSDANPPSVDEVLTESHGQQYRPLFNGRLNRSFDGARLISQRIRWMRQSSGC
uniref:HAT C-terminal dimerisation domain-containing protein n=1 Tax=Fusarium oxysporum (strain Fo5176) TaxID=660025 RepID=A0A0D2YCV7_FUSOF